MAAMGDEAKFYAEEVNNVNIVLFVTLSNACIKDLKIPKQYKCVTQLQRGQRRELTPPSK